MKYTEPRYTKDLDLWIRNSPDNSKRVYDALAAFGARTLLGIRAFFISLEDLIANKKVTGRCSDLEHLEYVQQRKMNNSD